MEGGEQTLLVILVAFAAGVAIDRLWRFAKGRGVPEQRGDGDDSMHYILGLDLLASRQIDRAVSELTMAARKNTDAVAIYLILGNLLREKGQIERAIQIHQGVLHRPGLSKDERAHALLCLGMDFKRAGFRNRALDTLREVVALEPKNAYALSSLIKIQEEEQDWSEALETLARLSEVTGEHNPSLEAFLHDRVGLASVAAGDDAKAAKAFEEAIRIQSRLAPPHLHLGDLRREQGRLQEAEAQWLSYAKDNPRFAHLVFDRLHAVREDGDRLEKMEEFYRGVIELDEKDWRARLALARMKRAQKDPAAAFELLMEAVHHNPHALAVHLEVWHALVEAGGEVQRIQTYLDEVAESAYFIDPYVCMSCSYRTNGILWRCPHCQEWDTFVEERVETVDHN